MVANDGYLPGKVNFSCRVARCAYARDPGAPPNIIDILKSYADRAPSSELTTSQEGPNTQGGEELITASKLTLRERLGDNFARGHKQASGGIVEAEDFEELCRAMEIGVKREQVSSPKKSSMGQKNTLDRYFGNR